MQSNFELPWEPRVRSDLLRVCGAVVIGRNEGERLKCCLRSLIEKVPVVVYVDSGSNDGSVAFARGLKTEVLELDLSRPFTMARARNAGLARLLELAPKVQFVQFVDGDCEILDSWIENGQIALAANPGAAVVGGRISERNREASVYKRLCDLEWHRNAGEVLSCYGIAMVRVDALQQVGNFNEKMIAGEESELCGRLRRAGWKIVQLDTPMAMHDAGITEFGQWWRRTKRSGHAYAEGVWLNGHGQQWHNHKTVTSIVSWGLGVPIMAVGLTWPTNGLSLLLLLSYGALWQRVRRAAQRRWPSNKDTSLYATFTVLGKIPQMLGVLHFGWYRFFLRRQSTLIEYK